MLHRLFAFSCLIFLFSVLQGQYVGDPITNVYKIGGSAELFVSYSTSGNTFSKIGVLDVDEDLNSIENVEDATQQKFIPVNKTATASGDFNGDGKEEVVTICDNISGGIKITIPLVGEDLVMTGTKEYILEELNAMEYTRVRLIAGNFDDDRDDEFVICYGKPEETIRMVLLETDAELSISEVDTYKEIAYYDSFFDIAAGDLDADGMDEIVMVKNKAIPYETNTGVNPPDFTSEYDLYVVKYNLDEEELQGTLKSQDIALVNQAPSGDRYNDIYLTGMRVSCGDLDADGMDEIAVGWSNFYCYNSWHVCDFWLFGCISGHYEYRYYAMTFLNTFDISWSTNEIANSQNLYVTHTDFGSRGAVGGMNIGMTLLCENLDNIGRDEVLINSASTVCILGHDDGAMGLKKKAEIGGVGGCLNTGGTETFVVADLNPDTANLEFNKEIVMLLSDQNPANQLTRTNDVASFEIRVIDQITADEISFLEPGPAFAFPFDDENIEVASLNVADIDLKNTDVYRIGTPDVIPVSELQYPLVILNAPPVHFDVFNGVSYDLCDAFLTEGTPTFSAVYVTEIDGTKTTKFEVDNSIGFSSEFKAYAMAGGSGFESTVRANWNAGKSYYKARSDSRHIEESKEVYTEDYVLYSSLDYTYYRYPIYNESQELIGRIAVLNPESPDLKSAWGSGNSWEHPGYVFNHEPGNLFSYKPFRNSGDFCPVASGFQCYEYTSVPVASSGHSDFEFQFANITDEGDAYSFSGGVGADLFTKVGVEGTATVELAPFGLGGSVSTDFRAGVSSELSTFYNHSSLTTHNTQLSSAFRIEGKIGKLNEDYDNVARYKIIPYIYRSQCGALVLDYMVNFDENNMDWWEENYGENPDLAFILPWKYAEEKGSSNVTPSKKKKTTDIQFFPAVVSPGDTVCITARVHNYSLKTFDNELTVRYFIGDPLVDGVELTDIYGSKGKSKYTSMVYGATEAGLDIDEYLSFNWKVPDSITCSPRIYVQIDPDDDYIEIHENNNRGWNLLNILDCADCWYEEVAIESNKFEFSEMDIYPRPASEYSNISFTLQNNAQVQLDLYTLTGMRLMRVADESLPAGNHVLRHDTGALPEGLYLYRLSAEGEVRTARLLIVK